MSSFISLLLILPEKTEVHASVCNVSEEVRMLAEIVILAVLENENAIFLQHIPGEYKVRDILQLP